MEALLQTARQLCPELEQKACANPLRQTMQFQSADCATFNAISGLMSIYGMPCICKPCGSGAALLRSSRKS